MAHAFDPAGRMTAEAFVAWAEARPDRPRHELLDGEVYAMTAEPLVHARAKGRVYRALDRQIAERRLACEAFPDGVAVRVDDATIFEPDALVRCGPPLSPDTVVLSDPLLVVEVASPSTQSIDALFKLTGYFRNPAITHYLIVVTTARTVLHYRRDANGQLLMHSHESGIVHLDPPGLELALADLFDRPEAAT